MLRTGSLCASVMIANADFGFCHKLVDTDFGIRHNKVNADFGIRQNRGRGCIATP